MHIEIDPHSGFCFGVQKAINKAEELLEKGEKLFCLGEIVHNGIEVNRLNQLGMHTTSKESIQELSNNTVLIRSHGEAPEIYSSLEKQNNKIIDATCPVVLKLQQRIKKSYSEVKNENGQLLIFGKHNHPEVIGLNGQTKNNAIVVQTIADLKQVDFNLPIELYSQTTMPLDTFYAIKAEIESKAKSKLIIHDTICRQVANRIPRMNEFSKKHDLILFVSGIKSSNGKLLFEVCKQNNQKSYFISSTNDIDQGWFTGVDSIGICGATSTPKWLLEEVRHHVENTTNS